MIKRNKWQLIASSIIILLPMLLGVLGDRFLPESFAIHWGFDGEADGFGSASIFFILPPILLALHWLCVLLTSVLDKSASQNKKVTALVLWIIPTLSLTTAGMIVSAAFGYTGGAMAVVCLLVGVMFLVIGNYMPKMTRSRTMGIKIKWAQASDENWNATHRFAGKVYMGMGFLALLCMPLPMKALPAVLIAIIFIGVFLPVIYSYRYYQKQLSEGRLNREEADANYRALVGVSTKAGGIATAILVPILLIVLAVVMFTGSIETSLGEDALTVEATYEKDLTVRYDEIESVEYREHAVGGTRVIGFQSARLRLGTFQNEELGTYLCYTYTGDAPCVLMTVKGQTVVVSTGDAASTKDIYDRIVAELAE